MSCGYAAFSGDRESESQSLGSPNRLGDLSDFDCGSFLAVPEISKTVCNGRSLWPVGLSGFEKWGRIRHRVRGSRLCADNEASRGRASHDLSRPLLRQCRSWLARGSCGTAEESEWRNRGPNVQRAPQATLRHPDRSRLPWIRAFLFEARPSDLMVSIFNRSQNRSNRAGDRKRIIELLLIILGAIAVIILGLYGGLASSHHS